MAADSINLSLPIMSIVAFLFTAAWALVLWFLRRLVGQFDKALEGVERVTANVGAHSLELAHLRSELERLREDREHDRTRVEDLVGFLQAQGFRKREGP